MGEFKRNRAHDFSYTTCIYSGISNRIKFETKYGTDDKTEELKYLVDRYCEEEIISGNYLKEELERYIEAAKERRMTT